MLAKRIHEPGLWRRLGISIVMGMMIASAAPPVWAYEPPVDKQKVSVSTAGNDANDYAIDPAVSADGKVYAFRSSADNLVPRDFNSSEDIFVYDATTKLTERVSVSSEEEEGYLGSRNPAVSGDGRFIAFESDVDAFQAAPDGAGGNWPDIFVRDRITGVTEHVSRRGPEQAFANFIYPDISDDGRFVAYISATGSYLSSILDLEVFVYDRLTKETLRIPSSRDRTEGFNPSWHPSISGDGRFIAFTKQVDDTALDDDNGDADVFVYDTETAGTEIVSVTSEGILGNGRSVGPSLDYDGTRVVFSSDATNFVPYDTNGATDVFMRDRATGTLSRLSVDNAGNQRTGDSFLPHISGNGRFVGYVGQALFDGNQSSGSAKWTQSILVDIKTLQTSVIAQRDGGLGANYAQVVPSNTGRRSALAFVEGSGGLAGGYVKDTIWAVHTGPNLGLGAAHLGFDGPTARADGWVRFSGATLAAAGDPKG
ncbi:MAG: TolB family protein, partial [Acidimicrobiia bacterium]